MQKAINFLVKRVIDLDSRIAKLKTDKNYRKITNAADRFGMIREREAIREVIEILNGATVSEDKVCNPESCDKLDEACMFFDP